MKATVLTGDLMRGLNVVSRVVAGRSQMAVLGNVLVDAQKSGVNLSATNLELGIRMDIGGKVGEEGAVTVPGKALGEFVGSFKGEAVDLESAGEKMKVRSGKFEGTFAGISATEFPTLPGLTEKNAMKVKSKLMDEIAREVAFAAAADESRPVLTGIQLRMNNDEMVITATDGFRLSRKVMATGAKGMDIGEGLILPARTIVEAARIGSEAGQANELNMEVRRDSNQVILGIGKCEMVSRTLEGNFPDVNKIIPSEWKTRMSVDREELVRGVRAAAVFAREANNIIKLKINNEKLTIVAAASQSGESEIELEADTEGEESMISFNYRYISDFLASLEEERVVFEMNGSLTAGVWRPEKRDDLLHIIMPVRV